MMTGPVTTLIPSSTNFSENQVNLPAYSENDTQPTSNNETGPIHYKEANPPDPQKALPSMGTVAQQSESPSPEEVSSFLGSVVMNGQGHVRQESEGYTLKPGEDGKGGETLLTPAPESELRNREKELRKALDPKNVQTEAQKDTNVKFGFPSSHFDEGAKKYHSPETDSYAAAASKLPKEEYEASPEAAEFAQKAAQRAKELEPQKAAQQEAAAPLTSAVRMTSMMPYPMSQSESLARLTAEKDPAKEDKINPDKMLESAAGLQYATNKGYDPTLVGRHSDKVDFHAIDKDGKQVLFDPFTSPQPKPGEANQKEIDSANKDKPEWQAKKNDLLKKQNELKDEGKVLGAQDKQELNRVTKKLNGLNTTTNPYNQTPDAWAKSTYTKHVDQSKGTGVTGVWDQTTTRADQIDKLNNSIKGRNAEQKSPDETKSPDNETISPDKEEKVSKLDLNLARAYTVEDDLARKQIEHRNAFLKANPLPQNTEDA